MSAQTVFDRFRPATAWQAYFPNGSNPWSAENVAHLYRRAGFGATWDEIQQGIASTPGKVVAKLLNGGGNQTTFAEESEQLADGGRSQAATRSNSRRLGFIA